MILAGGSNHLTSLPTLAQSKTASVKWNWLLRQCGYSGFADKEGKGYIHTSEPVQAVFLSKDSLKVIGRVENKSYENMDPRQPIRDMLDFIKAWSTTSHRFDNDEFEYDKSLLKWLVSEKPAIPVAKIPDIKVQAEPPTIWKSCNKTMFQIIINTCDEKRSSEHKENVWWKRMRKSLEECWNKSGNSVYNS